MTSQENPPAYLSSWMGSLPKHLLFRDLIIPGSHSSNSNDLYKPKWSLPFTKCQEFSVSQQLKWGVRYLDIKFGVRKDKIYEMLGINK
jgi:hypothetical protein